MNPRSVPVECGGKTCHWTIAPCGRCTTHCQCYKVAEK